MINIVHAWNFMYENAHSYELLLFMYDILDHGYEILLIMDDQYWSWMISTDRCIISWPLVLTYQRINFTNEDADDHDNHDDHYDHYSYDNDDHEDMTAMMAMAMAKWKGKKMK